MMENKFTPYGYTSIPSTPSERDPNGVYFIRTANGFLIRAIANDANKTIVDLEVFGYVNTTSGQEIDGIKKFLKPIRIKEYNTLTLPASNEMDVSLKSLPIGGIQMKGIHIVANTDKHLFVDFQELDNTITRLRATKLEEPVIASGEFLTKNLLGWKKEFLQGSGISVPIGTATFDLSTYYAGWDDGKALERGMNWDIVWEEGTGGKRNFMNLKTHTMYFNSPPMIQEEGGDWYLALDCKTAFTIPPNNRLVIW